MDLDVQWEPTIGDPTFMGWFTVAAYFVAAVVCGAAARTLRTRLPEAERRRQPAVWWAVFVLMAALGVNKQLDLQSWFTAVGRAVAHEQGWFDRRAAVQRDVMIAFLIVSVALVAWISVGDEAEPA